ncbi:hypothetical protein GQ55_9G422500 [Panicum hallii var. hallii]|uniref:Uncharacterized protein n=1 Tax=Panicum hallii var. hallii TaxID=1504633 RepID=A0A2T7CAQ3_9POAL|nr:hypothetical protein GQ55_9G422500 [Panicum hallii var. hallii]
MAHRASSTEQPAEGLPTTPIRASRSLAASAAMSTLRSTLQPSGPAGQAMLPDGPIEEAGWELRGGRRMLRRALRPSQPPVSGPRQHFHVAVRVDAGPAAVTIGLASAGMGRQLATTRPGRLLRCHARQGIRHPDRRCPAPPRLTEGAPSAASSVRASIRLPRRRGHHRHRHNGRRRRGGWGRGVKAHDVAVAGWPRRRREIVVHTLQLVVAAVLPAEFLRSVHGGPARVEGAQIRGETRGGRRALHYQFAGGGRRGWWNLRSWGGRWSWDKSRRRAGVVAGADVAVSASWEGSSASVGGEGERPRRWPPGLSWQPAQRREGGSVIGAVAELEEEEGGGRRRGCGGGRRGRDGRRREKGRGEGRRPHPISATCLSPFVGAGYFTEIEDQAIGHVMRVRDAGRSISPQMGQQRRTVSRDPSSRSTNRAMRDSATRRRGARLPSSSSTRAPPPPAQWPAASLLCTSSWFSSLAAQ